MLYFLGFLTLIIAILSLEALYSSRQHSTHTLGATVTQFLPLLEPGEHIGFALPESVRRIEELVLFVDSNSYQTSVGTPLTVSLRAQNPGDDSGGSVHREVRLGEWQLGYREFEASAPEPTALEFSRLNYRVQGNAPIVLDIGISGAAHTSLLLLGSTAFDPQRVANFTAESIARKPGLAGMQLAVQTRYTKESRLEDIAVVAGVLMLVAAACFMAKSTTGLNFFAYVLGTVSGVRCIFITVGRTCMACAT